MSWIRRQESPWWQAGRALGLLSTTLSRAAGMAVSVVVPEQVASNAYRQMVKPLVGWEFMLVLDIPVGGNWPRACRLWRGSDG